MFGAFRCWGFFFHSIFFHLYLIAYENLFVILHKVFNFPSSSGHVQNRAQDSHVLHTDKPIKTKVCCCWLAKRDQIQQTEGVKFRNCDQYWGLCLSLTANSILKENFQLFSLKSPLQVKLMFQRVITKGELLRQLSFHWSLSMSVSVHRPPAPPMWVRWEVLQELGIFLRCPWTAITSLYRGSWALQQ